MTFYTTLVKLNRCDNTTLIFLGGTLLTRSPRSNKAGYYLMPAASSHGSLGLVTQSSLTRAQQLSLPMTGWLSCQSYLALGSAHHSRSTGAQRPAARAEAITNVLPSQVTGQQMEQFIRPSLAHIPVHQQLSLCVDFIKISHA